MRTASSDLVTRVTRALLFSSTSSWTPSLEQTLHKLLTPRDSLSPSLVSRVIDHPSLQTHPQLALGFFHWASQQPNFSHSSQSYQSILKTLSLSRHFTNTIQSLFRKAKAEKFALDGLTYRFLIRSLLRGRKTQMAYSVFNEGRTVIPEIGFEECNSLLAALGSDGYLDDGLKVLDEMSNRDVGFSTIGFGVFIWRFCKNGEMGKVLSLLERVSSGGSRSMVNGSVVALMIVHGLCEGSRLSEALWALNELRRRGFKPDFMAYRIVAEAFRLKGGSSFDVNTVLRMKRKLGVAPRSGDYKDLILGLIMERRVVEAKEIGEVIVDGNFPMDDDVLNTLIGSVSSVDPCSCLVFFNYCIRKGKILTLLTVTNLSRNLCKLGKVDELLEVYRVLTSIEFFCDVESYNVMFSTLCRAGRVREAYGALQEMKKKGLGPDISSYNVLLESCCREDMLRPAKKLWDEMFVTGCGVNLKSYSILIGKFCEVGEVEEALRLYNHMLDKGVTPDAATYTSLLEGLCQDSKFETAIKVFKRSVKQDILLARSILSIFVRNLFQKGQFLMASELLLGLSDEVAHSDSHLMLLKSLADAKEVLIAHEHVKQIRDTSPSILQDICSELLAVLSHSSEMEPILHLLQVVPEQCLDSSSECLKHVYSKSC